MASRMSIAVIGGGASGAGAAKALLREGCFSVKVFEQRSYFGGLWNYTIPVDTPLPSHTPTEAAPYFDKISNSYRWSTPVYDLLDTNVPGYLMAYSGQPFPENTPLFPVRSQVLAYLEQYSADVAPVVQFGTKVVSVLYDEKEEKWLVRTRPVDHQTAGGRDDVGTDSTEAHDAVVMAVGNYDAPFVPHVDGMEQFAKKHPGVVQHVKSFRHANRYSHIEGNIVVVGNGASANDVAYQMAVELKRPIYKLTRSPSLFAAGKSNLIREVGAIRAYDADRKEIVLADGSRLTADLVLYATGYLKSFPFLHLPPGKPPLVTDGHSVHGTYQHVLLRHYPRLAVVGLPRFVLPTRTSESQGCWLAKIWSGKIPTPTAQEMEDWENERIEVAGTGKAFHDLPFPSDISYCNHLNDEVFDSVKNLPEEDKGLLPRYWDEEQIRMRACITDTKAAYIKYTEETGKLALSYEELGMELPTDEELKNYNQ